ncbi:MAG TPA: addiction module protein [Candidatus Paceibacterota bacterium]|nr:addiction module protein [Verrucomicrobiota bacterium]HSA09494.1 addiction module protein [Candidatus Paceibacterota bacterium]
MAVTLPIGRMSRADKLRAMEALWADLSRDEAEFESPDWHGTVLRETERLVRDGKAKFSNWPAARRRIHRKAGRPA